MDGERQDCLGNLQEKTLPQLLEILQRQEKLLSKRTLLDTLPDSGQKIQHFVETLQRLILQRQVPDTSTFKNCDQSISRIRISCDRHSGTGSLTQFTSLHESSSHGDKKTTTTSSVRNIQSTKNCDILQEQGTPAQEVDEMDGATAALTDCLESLALFDLAVPQICSDAKMVSCVPSDGRNLETALPNSYKKVIERSTESGNKRTPFKPCSSLKIADIQQLPEEYKQKSRTNHNQSSSHVTELDVQEAANQKATKLKRTERLHEESAVHGPMYKFSGAKEIPMVDSIWLQRERKKQLQKIQTIHAAEKLAEQLNVKTSGYKAPTLNMDYQKTNFADSADVSGDSDDITDEEDVLC